MTTEITLVRLPVRLSDLVDEAVDRFVAQHPDERLQANRRYHDADLWMVFRKVASCFSRMGRRLG